MTNAAKPDEEKKEPIELTAEELKLIMDNLHDEIMVYDDNFRCIYVNKASLRHYGIPPEDLIGKQFEELDNTYWGNSTLPEVYEKKDIVAKRQITNQGNDIITISVPVLDEQGAVRFVVQNVNDIYMLNRLGSVEERFVELSPGNAGEPEYIYSGPVMEALMDMAKKISSVDSPCLLLGETGTGKTLLAKQIHAWSPRRGEPFLVVNCACMNPNLIESELFGYEKGAFSGANPGGKKGIVEAAEGGTLLLDEISEIPVSLQSKLLQFIQDKTFTPLGSTKEKTVDVRILAATNRNLAEMVAAGTFREDLYYRLNTFELTVPPLRARRDDIRTLVYHYLNKSDLQHGREHVLSDAALDHLLHYRWPGNIRELSHVMEKMVVLTTDYVIDTDDLPGTLFYLESRQENDRGAFDAFTSSGAEHAAGLSSGMLSQTLPAAIAEVERVMVERAYKETGTSTGTARILGVSQSTAYRLIQKHHVQGEGKE